MNGARETPKKGGKSTLGSTISAPPDPEAARREKLAGIPRKHRLTFLRAWTGRSRMAAMRAFCLECVGYQSAEVGSCTDLACPLYPYRENGRSRRVRAGAARGRPGGRGA